MKRIVTWISVLLLAAGLLGGCASKTAEREGESLPRIIVGSDSYPPYVYLDNNGDPIGIDVDIAKEAFRRMGYQAVRPSTGSRRIICWKAAKSTASGAAFPWRVGSSSINGRDPICSAVR